MDEFTRDRKREYAEAPSSSAVDRAIESLQSVGASSKLVEEERDAEMHAREEANELRKNIEAAEAAYDDLSKSRPDDMPEAIYENRVRAAADDARMHRDEYRRFVERDRGDRGPDFRRRMALIERSARLEYLTEASQSLAMMLVCASLYLAALVMLGRVLFVQAMEVARVTGWL